MEAPTIAAATGGDQSPRFDAETHPSALDYVPLPVGALAAPPSVPVAPPVALERPDDSISPPVAPARSIRGARGPPSDHA